MYSILALYISLDYPLAIFSRRLHERGVNVQPGDRLSYVLVKHTEKLQGYHMEDVDFYEKGIHTKTITFEKIEKISGIFTPRKLVMERTDGKGKSILYVVSIKYDVPVPDSKLKRESF